MKRTNIFLDESMRMRLASLAAKIGQTPAALVRQAIAEFLKRNKG